MTEVQKKILKLYKKILPLLEEHEIKFTANGGTCIGACREQGFIEWDDDLDINILPDDFGKMMEIFDNLPSNLYWKYHRPGVYRLLDKEQKFKGKDIFIDFMALEYVRKNNVFINALCLALTAHIYYNWTSYSGSKYAKWYLKWPIAILTFWFPTPISRWILQKLFRSRKKTYISSITNIKWWKSGHWESDLYRNRVKKPFENTYIYVPADYDKYLTKEFGNWNKPVNWNQDHYK